MQQPLLTCRKCIYKKSSDVDWLIIFLNRHGNTRHLGVYYFSHFINGSRFTQHTRLQVNHSILLKRYWLLKPRGESRINGWNKKKLNLVWQNVNDTKVEAKPNKKQHSNIGVTVNEQRCTKAWNSKTEGSDPSPAHIWPQNRWAAQTLEVVFTQQIQI